jgi:membrane associated rhomboid family serine protease
MGGEYRPTGFKLLPDVVKNLLIINGLLYLATIVMGSRFNIDLTEYLGLHMVGSDQFAPYQFVTYMFLHDPHGLAHIFFNMFALWMFGNAIENTWGPKRFLIYYIATGLGAALTQYVVFYFEMLPTLNVIDAYIANPDFATLNDFLSAPGYMLPGVEAQELRMHFLQELRTVLPEDPSKAIRLSVEYMQDYRTIFMGLPNIIGASGAVFGLLLAFGMLFPNTIIYIYFAIPIKAKYFVILYGALELFMGISGSQSNVAHFAHLGGMLFGFLLLIYWKRKNRFY